MMSMNRRCATHTSDKPTLSHRWHPRILHQGVKLGQITIQHRLQRRQLPIDLPYIFTSQCAALGRRFGVGAAHNADYCR